MKQNAYFFTSRCNHLLALKSARWLVFSSDNDLPGFIGKNNIDLCRDDGLAILDNASGPESDSLKEKITKLFPDHG